MPLKMFQKTKIKQTIAIASGKGGVGKSTVTVHLAYSLQSMGYSVGILDADIYGPSIRLMLPEDTLPTQQEERLFPAVCKEIKMLSMAFFRNENQAAVVRAPIANSLITQFLQRVEWGELDFLLIDFPPGTGDVQLTLSQQANLAGAVMVTTPQQVAVMDVKKAIDLFEQVSVPIIGIVENMGYLEHKGETLFPFGKDGGKELSQSVGVPFLGSIPIDSILSECGDTGKKPIEEKVTDPFDSISAKVIEHLNIVQTQQNENLTDFELVWREI